LAFISLAIRRLAPVLPLPYQHVYASFSDQVFSLYQVNRPKKLKTVSKPFCTLRLDMKI